MRITLELPDELLNEAMRVSRIKTKTEVILVALEELIRRHRIAELKAFKGKVGLDIDLGVVRGR